MLLYIHVPFCRSKCRYCSFHSEVLPGLEPLAEQPGAGRLAQGEALDPFRLDSSSSSVRAMAMAHLGGSAGLSTAPLKPVCGQEMQDWLDTLLLEIALWGDRLHRPEIRTVFFGGGTPSLVPPSILGTILNRVRRAFRLDPKAEISMEANPESINRATARAYGRAGVNRISLGVQALDDELLSFMGRPHSVKDALRAYQALRDAKFHNVGLDLIWGLPGQSARAWQAQLREVIRLRPDHLSCYGLTLEEGTPMAAMHAAGLMELPGEREQASMYINGSELLEEAGFLHYEVSNFARMGYLCRHNLGYWDGEDYLGLGPAATSTIQGKRWTNPRDRGQWRNLVNSGLFSPDTEELSLQDRVLELIMLRLRTTRGMRVKAYRELTGRDFLRDNKPLIHALHRNGLIRIQNGYMRLTRNGLLVSNSILEHFFESTKAHLENWASPQDAPLEAPQDATRTASPARLEAESLPGFEEPEYWE